MLGTLPPTNWFQIFKKIPLLLVMMSHRKWVSKKNGIRKKGGGSQISITILDPTDLYQTSLYMVRKQHPIQIDNFLPFAMVKFL